mmetsp:Transcript_40723/g.88707  ORF Transcript_40723/g.88707 Transcript_40723/m.88707 type:complete len:200 (+) Transcript_40723:794-1393(+)
MRQLLHVRQDQVPELLEFHGPAVVPVSLVEEGLDTGVGDGLSQILHQSPEFIAVNGLIPVHIIGIKEGPQHLGELVHGPGVCSLGKFLLPAGEHLLHRTSQGHCPCLDSDDLLLDLTTLTVLGGVLGLQVKIIEKSNNSSEQTDASPIINKRCLVNPAFDCVGRVRGRSLHHKKETSGHNHQHGVLTNGGSTSDPSLAE